MNGFEQYGEAMLLANEGNTQLATILGEAIKRMVTNFRVYVGAMPTSLPPTESFQPK